MRLAFVALVMLLPAVAAADDWKESSYPELHFSIQTPRPPEATKQTVEGPSGPLQLTFYSVDLGGDRTLMYVVAELPATDKRAAGDIIDATRDGAVNAVSAKITADKKVKYRGVPGREFTADAEKYHVRARVLLADGRRLFQLMVVAPIAEKLPAEADRFLDSLRFTK